VSAEQAVRARGQAAPDFAVKLVPLPLFHRDMAGKRVEQPYVIVGRVPDFPVEPADADIVE
jgi:hypothetical protein